MFTPGCKDTDHRETPKWLKQAIYDKFSFGESMYDPCPLEPEFDGLVSYWHKNNFVNPPYSNGRQKIWTEKAIKEYKIGRVVYLLLKFDTSTELYNTLIVKYCRLIYTFDCRIPFTNAGSPNFDNALFVFSKVVDSVIEYPTTIIKQFPVKHLKPKK